MPPKSLQLPSLAALHHFVEECMDRPTDSEGDEPGFGCEFYPRGSSATPSTCPSKCGHCASHYLSYRWQKLDPYAEKLSDDEARATIQKDLQTTDENLEYVHDMLMLYGNGILKRWQKRNVSKRAMLLRKAMPEMHQHMWSEARHIPHCRSCKTSKHTAPHRKCWLLPHLSIEELSQDWTKLLALIHVRTTFSPSEWFDFDVNCLENGWHFAFLDVAYNPHCVDVRHENFGQLQQWDAAEAHRGVIVGFPRAQLAFEAQSELSGFLRVMINLLLGSTIDEIASGSDHWQTLATEDFAGDGSGQVARSAYLNQPYCTPCKFDIDRIRDLFQTRYDDAKDELWLLQTNPMHLREQLARAQRSSYYRQLDTIERSTFMIDSALSAVNHLDHATRLSSEVGTLLDILRTYEGQFTIGDALPKDYDDCLRSLYVVLMSQWKLQVEDLYNMVLRVSAFQHHFRRYDDGTVDYKTSPEEAFRSDRLFWNVMKLIERNYNPIHKPAFHFAYVESLLANAPTAEKDNIDYVLYEQLSDLSTIDEALTILRSHRPHMGGPMSKEELDATRAKIGVQEYFESLRHNLGSWHNVEPLVKPLEEFLSLSLPSAKLNETSVSRFSDLHTSMCKFWHEVRLVRVLHLKKSGVPQEKRALSTRNLLEGVAEGYKSALKKGLESFRDAVKAKETAQQSRLAHRSKLLPSNPAPPTWNDTPSKKDIQVATPKAKQKTRPTAAGGSTCAKSELRLGVCNPEPAPQRSTIAVSQETLELFHRMFNSSESGKRTSDCRWEDFVSALRDTGCAARQNGGSAVAFTHFSVPDNLVAIHRPHPNPTINPIMLRTIGKKLERRFGWNESVFVEREKEGR